MSSDNPPVETIFLSYDHRDVDRIEPILNGLKSFQWTVYVDRFTLLSGDDWEKKIPRLIENAYGVVVLWSHHSVQSKWVRKEAALGLAKPSKARRLFPVLLDRGIKPPAKLRLPHAVDLSDWNRDPNDQVFRNLVLGIENTWTLDRGMALRKNIKALKTIRFVQHSPAAAEV